MKTANFLPLLLVSFLSGCSSSDCLRYEKYVNHREDNAEITQWADKEIFQKKLGNEDLGTGFLAGPGKGTIMGHGREALKKLGLGAEEVWWIGPDQHFPDGIFVGRSSYNGLIIAKRSIADLESASGYSLKDDKQLNRVALICYERT